MSSETQGHHSAPELDCSKIKKEPDWSDDYKLHCPFVKQESEDAEDLSGFDPHAWALNHLKIETIEPLDEYVNTASRIQDCSNLISKTNSVHSFYSQLHVEDANFTQKVSCSYPIPHVNNVWAHFEKVFYCEICSKSFSTKGNLSNHMRSHTQEKPFKCDTCGRCFSFNCNLKTHYLTHTGVKPFQCTVCGKCFSTKGNMSVHLRIHTGERPFKCSVCARSFTVKDNLQRHMKIHVSCNGPVVDYIVGKE